MSTVTILGKGNIGSALAGIAGKAGREVQVLDTDSADTPVTGDVVVLAVPFAAVDSVVAQRGEQLAGKVVVDVTNPVDFATFDGLVVPADSSAAAHLQAALPESKVVKAFNTTFAATLASGSVGDSTTTILIAGDDAEAKSAVSALVTDGGLKALDAGSLKRARELEALGFLQITLAASEQVGWDGGFAVVA
ncbi:MAG: diguanylate cyclase [Frankiales bacterium]|nr:diguanylate cyclase [Frankiales bacterium]